MADFHSFKNLKDPCSCPIGRQCKYTASCEQILGVLKNDLTWKHQPYAVSLVLLPLVKFKHTYIMISNPAIIQTVVVQLLI